jgi:hypothetical protein
MLHRLTCVLAALSLTTTAACLPQGNGGGGGGGTVILDEDGGGGGGGGGDDDGGGGGGEEDAGGGPTNNPNDPFGDCPVEARPVYVVDTDRTLSRFEPDTLEFTDLGRLSCNASGGASPFSMSVDRTGRAWVLYSSGEIFYVEPSTLACTRSVFQPGQRGFDVFGMGFVLDEPGTTRDRLFVAGGGIDDISSGGATLGQVSMLDLSVAPVQALEGWPELTGTALGDLWGFFPGTSPPRVARISRTDGSLDSIFPITTIDGDPNAWAFAFWGGDFWLFYKSQEDPSTRVFKLESDDGSVTEVLSNTGRYIVGAGVSTCAPTVDL